MHCSDLLVFSLFYDNWLDVFGLSSLIREKQHEDVTSDCGNLFSDTQSRVNINQSRKERKASQSKQRLDAAWMEQIVCD